MTWARMRQITLITLLVGMVAGVLWLVLIPTLYRTPTCFDGKQNQHEEGVDCGGPCAHLCSVSERLPSVRFVRTLNPTPDRTDVIAYIDNPNALAQVSQAAYQIDFYGSDHTLLGTKNGAVDLPAGSTVSIFLPDVLPGEQATEAFLTIATSSLYWTRPPQTPATHPTVGDIQVAGGSAPRITASLGNPGVTSLYNVVVIATVFDINNNAIAASETLVPELRGQATVPLTFTWLAPFNSVPARVDLLPVIPVAEPQTKASSL